MTVLTFRLIRVCIPTPMDASLRTKVNENLGGETTVEQQDSSRAAGEIYAISVVKEGVESESWPDCFANCLAHSIRAPEQADTISKESICEMGCIWVRGDNECAMGGTFGIHVSTKKQL